ncbi:glycosyl hydrolase [Pseudoclavibacter terrae]|uniref:LPXTG cell wall anchor domain-containing protein n=1 Tax=Pseudoclavibacter terrae TaxID=1530195 RepID=A0A7J5AXV4_9MICO|nr:glycosyl hydrolase [Pseudoclavibacter terrae]KAB1636258.1 LPXTG cell wall anchor domain-containing protein [Pseudoclavibacter terrae]
MALLLAAGSLTIPAGPVVAAPDSGAIDQASLRDPGSDQRPGMRWWWQTPISEAEALRELHAISDAGFSSVEIAFSAEFWANEVQRDILGAVLDEAAEIGVKASMTMGAAWPVQTPNTGVGTPYVQKELQYGRIDVASGATYSGTLPKALDDAEGSRDAELVAVSAARVVTAGPVVEGEAIPPASSTILDPASVVDLTSTVDDGSITWTAPPEGDWILFAYWQRDAEQGVTSAFDADAARAATEYLDEHQIGDNGPKLTKVGGDLFEDSLELNADSLFWTPDFVDDFKAARGYDPTAYLPFFFAHGMARYWVPNEEPTPDFAAADETGERIRTDYYTTLTDLYVDEHLRPYQEWAQGYGVDFKTQPAYGQNLDVIRSARELALMGANIEGESLNSGDRFPVSSDEATWRYALDWQRTLVAGAHQGGATRISSELGAQFTRAYEITLGDYQQLMDKEWAAGLTKPYVHGYASQSENAPWPTQDRFWGIVGESWNDQTYPQWSGWNELTDYWARGTLVLETGVPKTDLAIYSTEFLTTTARGAFDTSVDAEAPDQLYETKALEDNGFSVQYIDPAGLSADGAIGGETLFPDGPAYQAVIIDETAVDGAAASALEDASRSGVPIVIVGSAPSTDASFASGEAGAQGVAQAFEQILASDRTRVVADTDGVLGALRDLGVSARVAWNDAPVLTQYRQSGDTTYVYLYNTSAEPVEFAPMVSAVGGVNEIDLWTGERVPVAQYSATADGTRIPMALEPLGTKVIEIDGSQAPSSDAITNAEPLPLSVLADGSVSWTATSSDQVSLEFADGQSRELEATLGGDRDPRALTEWSLSAETVSPDGSTTFDAPAGTPLGDWREIDGLTGESGVGTYRTEFTLPESWFEDGAGAQLALNGAKGTSVVRVNGVEVSRHVGENTMVDVASALTVGANIVEVEIATTLRNKVTSLSAGTPNPFPGERRTHPIGLTGPVTLLSTQEVAVNSEEPGATLPPSVAPTATADAGSPPASTAEAGAPPTADGGNPGGLASTGADALPLAALAALLLAAGATVMAVRKRRKGRAIE